MSLLVGRVGLVTGGGSGIGRAICERLAEHGARLVVADLDKEKAKETVALLTGHGHTHYAVDVSNRGEVEEMQRRTLAQMGTCPQVSQEAYL